MYTLDGLQQMGCLSGSLVEVRQSGAVTESQLLMMTEEEQQRFRGVVVADGARWVATVSGMSIEQAKNVYSSDGETVCVWKATTRTFCTMKMQDEMLAVNKVFSIKEEKKMADEKLELDPSVLADLNDLGVDDVPEAAKMDAFDQAPKNEGAKEETATEKKIRRIRERLGDETFGNRDIAIINNQKYGRLVTFITKTDPAIKLGVKKTVRLDAQGNVIPLSTTSAEDLKNFKETGKLSKSCCETEQTLQFTQSKPGKPIAVVIKTPTVSDLNMLAYMNDASTDLKNDGSMETHVVSMETALSYIAYNYNGRIKEDENVLGKRACVLQEKLTPYVPTQKQLEKNPNATEGIRASLVVSKESKGIRKSLLTEGNFVPLKVFATIPQQDLSPEDAKVLNLNVAAALKSKSYDTLADSSKALVKPTADGMGYTSVWFDEHKPINVSRFDDANASVTDVRVPVRERKTGTNKNGQPTVSYPFQYYGMEDRQNGPLANPIYAGIIEKVGLPVEEFISKVTAVAKAGSNSKSKAKATLTPEEYLRVKLSSRLQADGSKSFKDLQAELNGITQ